MGGSEGRNRRHQGGEVREREKRHKSRAGFSDLLGSKRNKQEKRVTQFTCREVETKKKGTVVFGPLVSHLDVSV